MLGKNEPMRGKVRNLLSNREKKTDIFLIDVCENRVTIKHESTEYLILFQLIGTNRSI